MLITEFSLFHRAMKRAPIRYIRNVNLWRRADHSLPLMGAIMRLSVNHWEMEDAHGAWNPVKEWLRHCEIVAC